MKHFPPPLPHHHYIQAVVGIVMILGVTLAGWIWVRLNSPKGE